MKTDVNQTIKRVTARTPHRCDGHRDHSWFRACNGTIRPGQPYIRSVIFPGHDSGAAGSRWHPDARPVVARYCLTCATGYTNIPADITTTTKEAP